MKQFGEELDFQELGLMVAEVKAWGKPEDQWQVLWSEAQLDSIWSGTSEKYAGECQTIVEKLLLESNLDAELPECTSASDGTKFKLDLSSEEHSLITWEEFRIMFSKYWISRKYVSTEVFAGGPMSKSRLRAESEDLNAMGKAQLIRRAMALGSEHQAKVDEALSNGADEDHLRAVLSAAAPPDEYEAMGVVDLSRAAVTLQDRNDEVDAAFASPDPAASLRAILRAQGSRDDTDHNPETRNLQKPFESAGQVEHKHANTFSEGLPPDIRYLKQMVNEEEGTMRDEATPDTRKDERTPAPKRTPEQDSGLPEEAEVQLVEKRSLDRKPPFLRDREDQWGHVLRSVVRVTTTNRDDGRQKKSTEFDADELPRPEPWMEPIANRHRRIPDQERSPQMFWFFLRVKIEQLLIRANHKAAMKGKKLIKADKGKEGKEEKLASDGKNCRDYTLRSIGSADGNEPASKFSLSWDLMQVVLLFYVLVSVPFALAFNLDADVGSTLWYWELFIDVYFVLDIVLYFRTPYWERGVLISDSWGMARRYVRGWLLPDVVSILSVIEYFLLIFDDSDDSGSLGGDTTNLSQMRAAKLVRLLKLAKLLKLARMKRSLSRIADQLYDRFGQGIITRVGALGSIVQLIIGFALSMHLVACVWFFLGDYGADSKDGWVNDAFPSMVNSSQPDPPMYEKYMTSMYTIMLGVFPLKLTESEQTFTIISVLINGFIFGSVAATFSSILNQLSAPTMIYNQRMDMLKTWMRTKQFDFDTQHEIEAFYAAKLSGVRGKVVDEKQILDAFQPAPIASEIVARLYTKTIMQVPMFSRLSEELITKLCLALTPLPALKGCPVVVQDRIGDCMCVLSPHVPILSNGVDGRAMAYIVLWNASRERKCRTQSDLDLYAGIL